MVDKLSLYFSNLVSTADAGTGIQNLKKALEDLETLLADAENKQVYDKGYQKWLEEVQPLAYDADDLLDDFATEALKRKLMAEETTMGRRPAKFPHLRQKITNYMFEGASIHGRDEDIKQIIELLLGFAPTGNLFDVIPIVGMGGIGKTTLAQHIYNHDQVESISI
ncbi:putative disease resistance protein RGA1 [Camellia sinensis]|uniref:putative disease resistance protein RGA1 n=1 Tax=Camellia sinensis TaxID=4442 RepID=UPI001036428D|nr:putative disease resistance protein RGA1 [Camellia sinensis]